MPIADVNVVEYVREQRRVAQRAASRVAAGTLGVDDFDLAAFLFADSKVNRKLAAFDLLDDGGDLEEAKAFYEAGLREAFEGMSQVDVLTEKLRARFEAVRLDPKRPNLFSDKPRSAAVTALAKRNAERSELAAARLMAVHLNQRAMYVALSRVLLGLAGDQASGALKAVLAHGALAMTSKHDSIADDSIKAAIPDYGPKGARRRSAPIVVVPKDASDDGADPETVAEPGPGRKRA